MRPERIIEAVVELLEIILATAKPASECVNEYTRSRRYIGSKDRRQLNDLVWGYLRQRARLDYALPQASLAEKVLAVQSGAPLDLKGAPDWVRWEIPEWLIAHIPEAKTELPALLDIPPVVLRVSGDRTVIQKQLLGQGIETEPTALSPYGLKMKTRKNISNIQGLDGQIEIQDEGSQAAALTVPLQPGDTVLDYCAGAGGKSLIFMQMMQNNGCVVAHDVSARSLTELRRRAERAGVLSHIRTTTDLPLFLTDNPILFQHVVADVPCSGTGTWRRCPDARWKLTETQLDALVETQAAILKTVADYVIPGGTLTYITCSLTQDENEMQIEEFLVRHSDFECVSMKRFSPARTDTDGLFAAVLKKIQ